MDARGIWGGVVGALFVLAHVPLLEVDPVGTDPDVVSSHYCFMQAISHTFGECEGGRREIGAENLE